MTPGRVLNSRAVQQGQPRIKRGLCLALVGAFELLSAADWNILISLLNLGLGDSRVSTRTQCKAFKVLAAYFLSHLGSWVSWKTR